MMSYARCRVCSDHRLIPRMLLSGLGPLRAKQVEQSHFLGAFGAFEPVRYQPPAATEHPFGKSRVIDEERVQLGRPCVLHQRVSFPVGGDVVPSRGDRHLVGVGTGAGPTFGRVHVRERPLHLEPGDRPQRSPSAPRIAESPDMIGGADHRPVRRRRRFVAVEQRSPPASPVRCHTVQSRPRARGSARDGDSPGSARTDATSDRRCRTARSPCPR